ncbi:MAG TPA: hypothetical protein VH374_12135 [Polyangia bacterium]|jgi:hypothetical protein|nr:hypothetical protein [Polyangia bacterium]
MDKRQGMTIGALLVAAGLGLGISISRCQPDQPRAQAAASIGATAALDAGVPDTGPLTMQMDALGLDEAEVLPIALH